MVDFFEEYAIIFGMIGEVSPPSLEVIVKQISLLLNSDTGSEQSASSELRDLVLPQLPLAKYIDHTLLKPEATPNDILRLCQEAKGYHFFSVCINSRYVSLAAQALQGTQVVVCSVVGFPLGACFSSVKATEAQEAVRAGASEIDMVMSLGALKAREYNEVTDDIRQVVEAAYPATVKVILEMGALTQEEKVMAAALAKLAGAHFVKTSTGFGRGSATVEDVVLLRNLVGPEMGVKASGGIRTREDAERMLAAGANRLGTSHSLAIVTPPGLLETTILASSSLPTPY